jgi:dolichol-phosphate mannosyltransferase
LTVVIPALDEARNLELLLPALSAVFEEMDLTVETVVVDGGSRDDTAAIAAALGARVIAQRERGYGGALLAGFDAATAPWVMTLDADLSHRPTFIHDLWGARGSADLIIASRYVSGGASRTSLSRRILSRILNRAYSWALSVPVRDMSSGFRLYRRHVLESLSLISRDFDVLPEILTRLFVDRRRIIEVPFQYESRRAGRSHVRLARFACSYLKTLHRLRSLRHSI